MLTPSCCRALRQSDGSHDAGLSVQTLAAFAADETTCRRRRLLAQFNQTYEPSDCAGCDVCLRARARPVEPVGKGAPAVGTDVARCDFVRDAALLLRAAWESGRVGIVRVIQLLRGSSTVR